MYSFMGGGEGGGEVGHSMLYLIARYQDVLCKKIILLDCCIFAARQVAVLPLES